jgi:hypothetical protein
MAKRLTANRKALIEHYSQAKAWISNSVYMKEIAWQSSRNLDSVDETNFLREYSWVVLNSGFREAIIRRHFNYLSLCFCDWESAKEISSQGESCIMAAMPVFGHRRKLESILHTANVIEQNGFRWLMDRIETDAITTLNSLPYIGKITAWHLAKNLGANVAKPDRHLVKIANRYGYSDVNKMCSDIQADLGDPISVADIVLWRYAEQSSNHLRA